MEWVAASVVVEYCENSDDLCGETVLDVVRASYVTGFGPGPRMTQWLDRCGCRYAYSTVFDDLDGYYPQALLVEFSDPQVAMLFKLTWG